MKVARFLFLLAVLMAGGKLLAQQLQVKWIVPDEVEYSDRAYATDSPEVEVKIDISLPGVALNASNVKLLRNGRPYADGRKELERMQFRTVSKHNFRLVQQIHLPEGESVWEVEVTAGGEKKKAGNPMRMIWNAGKPNLFIISVGVPYELDYAQNDAREVFSLFQSQAGQLFGSVHGELLICDETTMRSRIAQTIANLEAERLTSKDIVLLFFSGHGKPTDAFGPDDFGLVANDAAHGVMRDDLMLLSYQQNIIKYIEPLPCKRVIMIDACHSGAAAGTKSWTGNFQAAQAAIATTPSGIVTISSSSGAESSYEDASWKHGAFTYSLLAGLTGRADKNHDGTVTVMEIGDHLATHVPDLVKAVKAKPQHPWIVRKPVADFPIFNYQHMSAVRAAEEPCISFAKNVKTDNEPAPYTNKELLGMYQKNKDAFKTVAVIATSGDGVDQDLTENVIEKLKISLPANLFIVGSASFLKNPSSEDVGTICIVSRLPEVHKYQSHDGHRFWVAQAPLQLDFYNSKTGVKESSTKIQGKDAQATDTDIGNAQEYALKAAITSIESKKFNLTR